MAEYTNPNVQTVNPGEDIVFTVATVPCNRGLVRWRAGTGAYNLSGWVPGRSSCGCNRAQSADYLIDFGANIAVSAGSDPGPISVSFTLDGATLQSTTMTVTPTVAEAFFNVSRATNVPIWRGCCQTVTVRNTGSVPIDVSNPNIIFTRPDLAVTY